MLLLFPLIVILILPDNVKGAENDVSVQTGGDLLLNVTEKDVLKKLYIFYWQFNSKTTLVVFNSSGKPTVEKNYTGRIEFFGDERCVKLKNLQKSDSGVYSAWGIGERRELLEKYNVTVKGSANQDVHAVAAVLAVVIFPYLVGVAVIAAITGAGFAVWYFRKKCKSSAASKDQKDQKNAPPVLFSADSGSTSPKIHMPLPPLFNNGAPHLISEDEGDLLMEKNSAD